MPSDPKAPIPYQVYMAEMEEFQRLIGGMDIPANKREALLGYIDGCKFRHGAHQHGPEVALRNKLRDTNDRTRKIIEYRNLNIHQVIDKLREEWGVHLVKPKKKDSE